MVISLQDQLDNLVTKLKTVLDILVELSDRPENVFVYNEQKEQQEEVVNFKRQISTYISGKFVETASKTQFPFTKSVNDHNKCQKLFPKQENVINTEFKINFKNFSAKGRSQFISSKSSHNRNSSNSRSSRASLAELEFKRQQAEILASQKKESYKRKIKLLERQKELELEMEKEKVYLGLVEVLNNLNLPKVKKNKIAGSSNSSSDNNSNDREKILENDIVSRKYNPVQSYDRPFCNNKLAKNSYQYCRIPVDNKRSNKSFQMTKPNQKIMKIERQIARQ